jgi:metallo-beta-lactamase class B
MDPHHPPLYAALAILTACAHAPGLAAPRPLSYRTYPADQCSHCGEWNTPHAPVRIFGNTYWVGTAELGAILVTSPRGHILIDAALPESAPQIIGNIRALGFRVEDVKLLLNSHAHFDHAGGLAAVHEASGAELAATAASRDELMRGTANEDDPQHASALDFPPVGVVGQISDGQVLAVGPLTVTAHVTGGHTPGSTTWTWESCADGRCIGLVYADSLTAISAPSYRYSDHPALLAAFTHAFDVLEHVRCDVLLTPHASQSHLWDRLAAGSLVDREACRRYAAEARARLDARLASERQARAPPVMGTVSATKILSRSPGILRP